MGGQPPPSAGAPQTAFSPDGLWWWDGAQWRPAVSPDGRWRWDGRAWLPAQAAPSGSRTGVAILVAVLAFGGVLFFVSLVTVLVLYTMGNQITNVFSNVAAALGSTPSP